MARRSSAPGTLIHCEYCGEDFSATYKRCPFCGEKPSPDAPVSTERPERTERSERAAKPERAERPERTRAAKPPEDDYVFDGGDVFDQPRDDESENIVDRSRGGKRLSAEDVPGPINWPRVITYICSLIIIAAALVIVFAYLYPKIHTAGKKPSPAPAQSAPPSQSQPVESVEPTPPVEVSDEPLITDEPAPSDEPLQVPSEMVLGIKLNKTDFTLTPDESFLIKATIDPASWEGEVTWSTTEPKLVKLESKGKVTDPVTGAVTYDCLVTNVNSGKSVLSATVTAAAGDETATAKVYCRPGSTPEVGPDGLGPGVSGTIVGASSGLRVRSGPGTSYDKVGSLRNGSKVTIVEAAGDGWYEVKYDGGSGYIKGEYISVG